MRGVSWTARRHARRSRAPGQQRAYLEQEMQAFKDGNRRNDIREQMRTIARQLTSAEIAMLAAYYSSISEHWWTLNRRLSDENNTRFAVVRSRRRSTCAL